MSVTAMAPADGAAQAAEPPKSKKKLIIIVVVLAIVAGAAYFFVLAPKASGSEAEAKPEQVPGTVVTLEPIQINLADGHYLKLGLALQQIEGGHEVDGSQALDAAITTFSNRDLSEVIGVEGREKLRKELMHHLEELYHHEVMAVYFVDYVTQ